MRYDDPDLGISWPIDMKDVIMSDKDRAASLFKDAEYFD